MMKLVLIACLLAAVNAGGIIAPLSSAPLLRSHPAPAPILRAAPLITKTVAVADAEYDPNPQYSYNYDIQDALTGDFKNHFESRNGDAVQGSYSLNDADGYRRIVEYTADPINGFNAIVHREPAHVAYAAPVAKVAGPLTYAAPLAKVASPLFQTIH